MRNIPSFLLFSLIFIGCNKDKNIAFELIDFRNKPCKNCATVSISIPQATGNKKLDRTINNVLKEELIYILKYDDEIDANSIESAIESFQSEYTNLRDRFPEESTAWEASITGEITFENEHILTIRLDYFLFTGGAHGYGSSRFLNFDKTKAVELNNEELFSDIMEFQDFAEVKFREEERIPLTESINSTGFMFEGDKFYLPENMGFTHEGLELFYEQYEVASYADGPIILKLTFAEIQEYLWSKIF